VQSDHGAIAGQCATPTLPVEGLDVAAALETLAAQSWGRRLRNP